MTPLTTQRKIFSPEQLAQPLQKIHERNQKIVLVGGCFDILHIGHLVFLEQAKKQGDILIVFLEADEKIKKTKGPHRPINSQVDRAHLLAAFELVDYVITLPAEMPNEKYDALVMQIKPAIIATTKGDAYRFHKERTAGLVDAAVIDVTGPVKDQSTTRVLNILEEI